MRQLAKKIWLAIEKISLWCLRLLFKLLHRELSLEVEEGFVQFVKFGLVGVSNTLLSYFINVGVLLALAPAKVSWDYFAGNFISFVLSVLWSFYWNNKYVFTQKKDESRNLWKALLRTYASYSVTGIVICNVLSWIWIEIFDISKFVAPIINLLVSVPLNFVLNKFWAFKSED